MDGHVGDEVVVMFPRDGRRIARDGEILEVRALGGAEAYRVRWFDNQHDTLYIPGPDVMIRHLNGCDGTSL